MKIRWESIVAGRSERGGNTRKQHDAYLFGERLGWRRPQLWVIFLGCLGLNRDGEQDH